MRPRHAEATPSEAYIKGRGLAWPLQLESCSYAYDLDAGPGTFVKIDLMGRRCLYSVSGNLEEGGVKITINFLSVCRE